MVSIADRKGDESLLACLTMSEKMNLFTFVLSMEVNSAGSGFCLYAIYTWMSKYNGGLAGIVGKEGSNVYSFGKRFGI